MKTTNKNTLGLVKSLYDLRIQKKAIDDSLKRITTELKLLVMKEDTVCNVNDEYLVLIETICRMSFDKNAAIADGVDIDKYNKKTFYDKLSLKKVA